jgi:stress response protein YsnF
VFTPSRLASESTSGDGKDPIVLPLYEEQIAVSKRQSSPGQVNVSVATKQFEQAIDELLASESYEIERTQFDQPIPVDSSIGAAPTIREEGDTIIIPVIEEVLVIQRRAVVKEEIRIRRVHKKERFQDRVLLRRQEAVVTRLSAEAPAAQERLSSGADLFQGTGLISRK